MTSDAEVHPFEHPGAIDDPLAAVLREGARRLLAQAIEAEAEAFLAAMQDQRLDDGRARVVRHGHGPERAIQTGIGLVPVRRVRLRDRGADEDAGEGGTGRIVFSSAILPRWARRTKSLDALLPILHLRGVSTGDFGEALSALLGRDAPNLSPSVVGRLKADWEADHERWQRRDLSARRHVHVRADGVYLQARMGEADGPNAAERMLVLIGATPEGRSSSASRRACARARETPGARCSWTSRHGAWPRPPRSPWAAGPWATGQALDEAFPTTRHQRCWQHKLVNVLNKAPRSVQPGTKAALREACCAPDRATARADASVFAEKHGAKHPKAVERLVKDQDALLAFFDFPAEHWDQPRARRTRSRACQRASAIEPCGRRAPCRRRRPASWPSSSSWRPRRPGAASRARTARPWSSRASRSPSASPRPQRPITAPPDRPRHPGSAMARRLGARRRGAGGGEGLDHRAGMARGLLGDGAGKLPWIRALRIGARGAGMARLRPR